ncbi:MAG: TetR/AcrR family transcriptional regulator [Planctomycetota bacterium]|nr:TetR/AcrR family transcriptional regulator [Planctomycetota bacterium]
MVRPLSPKQQEIRDREARILDEAQTVLLARGAGAVTMDRMATAVGVSKGTVYQHFSSKEDLLAAVLLRSADIRARLFERAASFQGRSRERMSAVGAAAELFFALYPQHEQAERAIKAASIAEKIDAGRAAGLEACTFRCFGVATRIVRDAIASGDLVLAPGQTVEQVCVGLWNLYTGAFLMRDLENFIDEPVVTDPMPILMANAQVFLDGFGWQPLSSAHDYGETHQRVLNEIFPDEAGLAGLDAAGGMAVASPAGAARRSHLD